MTVGERIKNRRKDLGLSAEQVAGELNISPSTVYRYENGAIEKMGIDKLSPIAEVLHTTPAYLIGWINDWSDYDKDEDGRLCEIPIAQFEALMEKNHNDPSAVWHDWLLMQDDALHAAQADHPLIPPKTTQEGEPKIENPDIRMIARAGCKMTPDQAKNLRKYAEFMFPEAFKDDNT